MDAEQLDVFAGERTPVLLFIRGHLVYKNFSL